MGFQSSLVVATLAISLLMAPVCAGPVPFTAIPSPAPEPAQAPPLAPGPLVLPMPYGDRCVFGHYGTRVLPVWVGDAFNASLADANLSAFLESIHGFAFTVEPFTHVESLTDAFALGQGRSVIVVAVTTTYYFHPAKTYLGYMCGARGHVSVGEWTPCPVAAFAHEVGHALSLTHAPSGIMREVIECAEGPWP